MLHLVHWNWEVSRAILLPLTLILACSRSTGNTRIDEDPVNSIDGSEPAGEPSAELFDLDGMAISKMRIVMMVIPAFFSAEDPFGDDIDQNCDGVDGVVPVECADFEIEDCSGTCSPAEWLGDGACDDGVYEYNGQPVDFNCEELNYDEGDCAYLFADNDGDGFTEDIDCDDDNPEINPGAVEVPNDGIDQNCDGLDQIVEEECADFEIVDCDGSCVPANWLGDGYCDNGNYQYNGVFVDLSCEDYNFDEGDCEILEVDNDGDGFLDYNDCDDNDPSINPGAIDIPNDDIDQNCDGVDATLLDGDGDGFTVDVDCDDADANIYPTAPDIPGDGIDQNCDGVDAVGNDNDGDGF